MVAAAVPALIVEQHLNVAGERRQLRFQVDVVKPRAAMDRHEGRTFDRGVPSGHNRRPGYIEPKGHVAEADPHQVSRRQPLEQTASCLRLFQRDIHELAAWTCPVAASWTLGSRGRRPRSGHYSSTETPQRRNPALGPHLYAREQNHT